MRATPKATANKQIWDAEKKNGIIFSVLRKVKRKRKKIEEWYYQNCYPQVVEK